MAAQVAHSAMEMHDLGLLLLQRGLQHREGGLDLDDLQIDLIHQLLRVAPEPHKLLLGPRERRLEADLELHHVRLELRVVLVQVGPQRHIRVARQLGAVVGGERDAVIVLQVLLLQGVDAGRVVGEGLLDVVVVRLLLLAHATDHICELLEAR